MTLNVSIGTAQALNGREAGLQATHQALNRLGSASPSLGFIVASHQYQARDVVSGVSGLLGDAPLIGFSSPAALTNEGLRPNSVLVALLSGDNRRTTGAVAAGLEVAEAFAEVSPAGKRERVAAEQAAGRRVLLAGDGVNDAPALTQADVGVAMGRGTDVTLESADAVLVRDDLSLLPDLLLLGRRTAAIVRALEQEVEVLEDTMSCLEPGQREALNACATPPLALMERLCRQAERPDFLVFSSPLPVPALSTEALHLGHGDAGDPHLGKGFADIVQLDHMPAELGLDRRGTGFAVLHIRHRLSECGNHIFGPKPPQISAVILASRVLGEFLGQSVELRALFELCNDSLAALFLFYQDVFGFVLG